MTEKNEIDISVIVPVYNVAEYLAACLSSLLKQGNVSLEVIMVDDGSTDSSADIAKQYEADYDNFFYYYKPNGGLGHARNYGVPLAHGKYIVFLDSDDIIVGRTYEKMFSLAELHNSELIICNVARFNSRSRWKSELHQRVFNNIELNTHIKKNHNLIKDTISCNKLILRSFYLKYDFKFPENILYEDIPVIIPMHILSNNVSVLREVGYLWRARDGATKSITQKVSDLKNLQDRLTVLKMLNRFFRENVTDDSLYGAMQQAILEKDLPVFIDSCQSVSSEAALTIIRIVKAYIEKNIKKKILAI